MGADYVRAVAYGNYVLAIQMLDEALQQTTGGAGSGAATQPLAQLYINRGYCNQKLQLYRKALKDFDAALGVAPGNPLALFRRGQALVGLKKVEEAKAAWNDALQTCGPHTDAQLVVDLAVALKDPLGAKDSDAQAPPTCTPPPGGGSALYGLLALILIITSLTLAGQYQLLQQVGLSSVVAPATPDQAALQPKAAEANGTTAAHSAPRGAQQPTSANPAAPPAAPIAPAPVTGNGSTATSTSLQQRQSQAAAGAAAPLSKAPAASALAAEPAGPRTGAASRPNLGTGASSKDREACDVEEVDCVAQQAAANAVRTKTTDAQAALNNSLAIQLAVNQINSGQVAEAEAILDKVISTSPKELGARVARGTARALRRDLQGAVEDFSAAIEVEPRYGDSWKRRGQARSALGDHEGALADLQKAIDLAPLFGGQESPQSRAECLVEKGMIYQKLRDYRRACRDLAQAVKLDPHNHQAWNVLGLCSTSQGDIRDGVRAYEKAVELNPKLKEAWINMGQALKEEGRTKEAERVFAKVLALDLPDAPSVHVLRVMAQMKQQKGEHAGAIKLLDKALGLNKEEQTIELLYLRAICYHALGYMRESTRDYDDCLQYTPRPGAEVLITEEARGFQFLSFYQKDMALYIYKSLDRNASDFCLDSELSPLFKETWCKKGPPSAELIASYQPQPALPSHPPPPPPLPDLDKLRPLTALADQLGILLQNHHQGFLPNVRQQRAAGYAAMELGQAMQALVAAKRGGRQVWVRSEGSSGQAGSAGRHLFGWRDAMDIVVKWRQLAEPNDQVVWVDLLTRREFEQGFGSHTPMFSGQTKCVRYYMNFARALELQRQVLLREGHAFDANNRPIPVGSPDQQDAIRTARTAEDMYMVIQQDSWVVVRIHSVARQEHSMEGTRLTLVRVPNQPDAYEFSIRTPVTPPRWKDFDAELEAAFENIVAAMAEGDLPLLASRILAYCYYWYNFMPLARGTAAVGYTTMLSLFWAAGMPVTAPIPKDYQVDWEAILAQHPDQFAAAVGKWLYPPQARGGEAADGAATVAAAPSAEGGSKQSFPPLESVPAVKDVIPTIRNRLEALNGEGARRIQ